MDIPRILNLGSGKTWMEDALNMDILPRVNPDWVYDICKPLSWDWPHYNTNRFGRILPAKGMFDKIIAHDVLEHLPNLVTAMTNCLSLLSVGGEMDILVPYDLSTWAWRDPTHVRAFNEDSWLYYTDWYWYLGWTEYRFTLKNIEYIISEAGYEAMENGVRFDGTFIRTPRMVNAMLVKLIKVRV